MESNKSKGVEELLKQMAWAAWQSAANAYRMYPENKHTFTDYWHDLGKTEAENLIAAHPQQSEGVGQAANGEMVDLLEFAAMNYQPNITSDKQVYWFEDDNETPILSEEIVERYLAEAQPSEPAALKEPGEEYCDCFRHYGCECQETCSDCNRKIHPSTRQPQSPTEPVSGGAYRGGT